MTKNTFLIGLAILLVGCKEKSTSTQKIVEAETVGLVSSFSEPYRPQFHFTPPQKWMNDPNGLLFENGVYHLYYQHYPEDIVWGPMHWGHATSKDMIHWKHQPIALYPDSLGLIFSGSAVWDKKNTSGFGTSETPPMVAIYTYHLMEGEQTGRMDFQTQGIAYSLDHGLQWEKYNRNPVIKNEGIKDFRDPKVFWDDTTSQWILALVAGDHVKFYRSPNLKDWKLLSTFGENKGSHGGVWECPDLFSLTVENTEEEKWVLLVSINPGGPNGGSATQYFVGDFDGEKFTTSQKEPKWIDYGMDNYAGVTYNNAPNNERLFIGWMSNWNYARDTPTEVWRSAMTLPRLISLHKDEDGYYIKNYPHPNFDAICSAKEMVTTIDLSEPFLMEAESFMQTDFSFQADLSKSLEVRFGNASEEIVFWVDPSVGKLYFDRTKSGQVDFEKSFGSQIQSQPYRPSESLSEVRFVIDQSSVEIFIAGGKYVFTNQLFPTQPYTQLSITGEQQSLMNVVYRDVNSIWNEQ